MAVFKQAMDIVGYIGTVWLLLSGLIVFIAWLKGILVPIWRLGNGLAKRKITIFAKGDNQESFKNLLLDSSLYSSKNIKSVTKKEDFGRAENSTLYLVIWDDFGHEIKEILNKKDDKTALIVFAKPNQLNTENWEALGSHRNVTVVNLKGRLLSDILVSLMVTGYEKR